MTGFVREKTTEKDFICCYYWEAQLDQSVNIIIAASPASLSFVLEPRTKYHCIVDRLVSVRNSYRKT